jgi:hypothetical protein
MVGPDRTVEKRSQIIENTLEPNPFFMKLRRPKGVGDITDDLGRKPLTGVARRPIVLHGPSLSVRCPSLTMPLPLLSRSYARTM